MAPQVQLDRGRKSESSWNEPSQNETLRYIKRLANAFWCYGCNLIGQWSPTCFNHSCGLLHGNDFYAIKLLPSNPSALIGLLICFMHLIVARNIEHINYITELSLYTSPLLRHRYAPLQGFNLSVWLAVTFLVQYSISVLLLAICALFIVYNTLFLL